MPNLCDLDGTSLSRKERHNSTDLLGVFLFYEREDEPRSFILPKIIHSAKASKLAIYSNCHFLYPNYLTDSLLSASRMISKRHYIETIRLFLFRPNTNKIIAIASKSIATNKRKLYFTYSK